MDKLMVQWVDMEDGGGLYYRLKDGREINKVLADTMRENERLAKALEDALKLIQGNIPLEMGRVESAVLNEHRNKQSLPIHPALQAKICPECGGQDYSGYHYFTCSKGSSQLAHYNAYGELAGQGEEMQDLPAKTSGVKDA